MTATANATIFRGTSTATVAGSGSATPTLIPQGERRAIFIEVWETIRDNYIYEDFRGIDWNKIRDEFEPRVLAAGTTEEFHTLLTEMVERLGDDHSRFLPPQEAREEDALLNGTTNYVGIGILANREERAMTVVYVFPDSPAERAGLMRRDRIVAVDGEPLVDADQGPSRIRGPEGTTVRLKVESPGRQPRDLAVERRAIRGKILPTGYRLKSDPDIGYLIIPDLFVEDMDALVEGELEKLLLGNPLKGLIVDIRGNGGGLRSVLRSILGNFITGDVGTFYSKEESYPLTIVQGALYDRLKAVPVVVLVDGGTQSAAEWLAATIQAEGRARVVGVKTAGNTETIYPYDLRDGSRLWVAQESFKLSDGTPLEGRGVIPDTTIDLDWTDYAEANDPHILEAIRILESGTGR